MNYTPTPRSDAAELTEPYEIRALGFCVVHIDFARQLERELAEAREKLSEWRILNGWGGTPEIINDFIKGQQTRIHHAQDLEEELAAVTAQRDRLAEALRMCQREMLDVLRDLQNDRQPFDGDDFHEALEKTEEALNSLNQPEPWGRMIL
jgi:DNA-binding transcriptional MerR regulator